MNTLTVYGSTDCMGWDHVEELLRKFRDDTECDIEIEVKDPTENWEEFREKGLVVCPSFVVGNELLAVGTPDFEDLKNKLSNLNVISQSD